MLVINLSLPDIFLPWSLTYSFPDTYFFCTKIYSVFTLSIHANYISILLWMFPKDDHISERVNRTKLKVTAHYKLCSQKNCVRKGSRYAGGQSDSHWGDLWMKPLKSGDTCTGRLCQYMGSPVMTTGCSSETNHRIFSEILLLPFPHKVTCCSSVFMSD